MNPFYDLLLPDAELIAFIIDDKDERVQQIFDLTRKQQIEALKLKEIEEEQLLRVVNI